MSLIYNPYGSENSALDWGFPEPWDPEQTQITRNLSLALTGTDPVAVIPVFCNEPGYSTYNEVTKNIDFSKFSTVLLNDIEFFSQAQIHQWATKNGITKYGLLCGGQTPNDRFDSYNIMYRPWWAFNLLKHNNFVDTSLPMKPFLFDVLLGARRPHRDFVMLGMQQSKLLNQSIVTYRSLFQGSVIDRYTDCVAEFFPNIELQYPYVSSNLNPNWEVNETLNYSISRIIPYDIYRQTYYSVICETLGVSDTFFMSEKITKSLFAKRLFVLFSTQGFLKKLKQLGFKTFDGIVDEQYDTVDDHCQRFKMAFSSLVDLAKKNPTDVLHQAGSILDHNHQRLLELQKETAGNINSLRQTLIGY